MQFQDASADPSDDGRRGFRGFWLRTRAQEAPRVVLWIPVLLGAGIAFYFALPEEPGIWLAPGLLAVAGAFGMLGREVGAVRVLAAALCAASLGFALAQWRAQAVAAPVVERRIGPVTLTGRVVAVEPRADGVRVLFDRLSVDRLAPAATPETVRLRLDDAGGVRPGDDVRVTRAFLMPPPQPSAPGAFDFARQAWFERLGAVGYARGVPEILDRPPDPGWRLAVNAARAAVVERIFATLPQPAASIVAALLAGEQGAVPGDVLEAFRDSGLQHILSISGLHIGMVAGIVFAAVRVALALVPALALRWHTKKIAALAAFAAITLYMLFAVPAVPIQRSWLMTGVVLAAVVIDRRAITLRLVAWAAFALLVAGPESLLSASFQMSFAAVVALVATFEAAAAPLARLRAGAGIAGRAGLWLGASVLTSLVAGLASAPFALYHFNRFSAFGLVANLLAVPLTGLWIMPWAIAAGLLFPFGLERLALVPMGWGIDGLVAIARMVAGWEGAVALFPSMPGWGLAATALGLVWLCIWRGPVRFAGAAAMAAALASIALQVPPDILVSGDGRLIAARDADGRLILSAAGGDKFARETWLRRDGTADAPETWPRAGPSRGGLLDCRPGDCVYSAPGLRVAIVRDARVLPSACGGADLVVATVGIREVCRRMAGRVVDRFDLADNGAHAIWLADGTVRIETVRAARGTRPWTGRTAARPPPS
jgi:competence protein ComEC